jgi:hypothetical protein
MNVEDFKSKIPYIIEHPSHGTGEREIICNEPNEKGVCYRHRDKTSSFGTYGKSWQEVYNSLYPFLQKEGYIN